MNSNYAWIIDRDHLYEEDPPDPSVGIFGESLVGTMGPGGAKVELPEGDHWTDEEWRSQLKQSLARNYQHHHQYRMYDDDGILYVTGTLYWNGDANDPDSAGGEVCYAPLRDYGEGALGAVEIRYTGRKEWDCG